MFRNGNRRSRRGQPPKLPLPSCPARRRMWAGCISSHPDVRSGEHFRRSSRCSGAGSSGGGGSTAASNAASSGPAATGESKEAKLCLSFVELMWAGMETRLFGVNIKRKKVKRKQSLNKKVRLICWDLVLKK